MANLLVLAGGMGSRYGGLKQLDPVGPNGEVLLDYSVHDAIDAGFSRVVFLIRRDFETEFRDKIISRYEGKIETTLAFQGVDSLPEGFQAPADREKPWGTGHAIWCTREEISEPFLAVNADDFYSREAYHMMHKQLSPLKTEDARSSMVAYQLGRTLSESGGVTRGICEVSNGGQLLSVDESSDLRRGESGRVQGKSEKGQPLDLSGEEPVSMNFWGFTPAIFTQLDRLLKDFLRSPAFEQPKSEFYIPKAVAQLIGENRISTDVLLTEGEWMGVTYREDKPRVMARLAALHAEGVYPEKL